ncbi:MAG: hypothetical protein NC078_05440, partial [Ruminococcus sp.]|nr:hypothetical protein [Ruminococcus sp.]
IRGYFGLFAFLYFARRAAIYESFCGGFSIIPTVIGIIFHDIQTEAGENISCLKYIGNSLTISRPCAA